MWGESRLLTASWDRKVCLWDLASDTRLADFEEHSHCVEAVAPLTDALFASGAMDWTICLWKFPAVESHCVGKLQHGSQVLLTHILATIVLLHAVRFMRLHRCPVVSSWRAATMTAT